MKKLVLFGAGKIGRSFIGQLFALSGYEVVFVDISERVIKELNLRNEYKVIIKSAHPDKIIRVCNVRGISGNEQDKVAHEIADCDIAAISVGQANLKKIVPVIAKGLILRRKKVSSRPLDIILAENMHNADRYMNQLLRHELDNNYPIDDLVGLIETSIGKMVPIIPQAVQEEDPLVVYAEPYNTLILDKKAFKNPIPEVNGLAPKENIKAWVDRKSYIHNFGHAASAYAGFNTDPSITFLADILNITSVKEFTRHAMLQSADVLMKKHPLEFTLQDLTDHIDDLLSRFENRALGDTVFRVGCDLKRKLHRNDRILSPLIYGIKTRSTIDKIARTFAYGLYFRAKDENGKMFPGDEEFDDALRKKGLLYVLINLCGLDPGKDRNVIDFILSAEFNNHAGNKTPA